MQIITSLPKVEFISFYSNTFNYRNRVMGTQLKGACKASDYHFDLNPKIVFTLFHYFFSDKPSRRCTRCNRSMHPLHAKFSTEIKFGTHPRWFRNDSLILFWVIEKITYGFLRDLHTYTFHEKKNHAPITIVHIIHTCVNALRYSRFYHNFFTIYFNISYVFDNESSSPRLFWIRPEIIN